MPGMPHRLIAVRAEGALVEWVAIGFLPEGEEVRFKAPPSFPDKLGMVEVEKAEEQ